MLRGMLCVCVSLRPSNGGVVGGLACTGLRGMLRLILAVTARGRLPFSADSEARRADCCRSKDTRLSGLSCTNIERMSVSAGVKDAVRVPDAAGSSKSVANPGMHSTQQVAADVPC